MNKLSVLTVFAVAAMSSPALAMDSATMSGPVKVVSCVVASSIVNSLVVTGVSRTNGVTVALMNSSAKAASDVTVYGTYNGLKITDTIKGPFPPGKMVQITKTYTPTVYVGPNASCHVTHVTFDDGTTWSASAMSGMSK